MFRLCSLVIRKLKDLFKMEKVHISSNITKLKTQIETFVFFDLETTGLDNPRIIELSMLAVSRKDLLKMKPKPPRKGKNKDMDTSSKIVKAGPPPPPNVIHKFTRLFNPEKLISPFIENLTGLSNETLRLMPPFSKSTVVDIQNFLKFPKPICLLAHNGKSFDFPILKAEIVNVKCDILHDIVCADTLAWARYFEANEVKLLSKIAKAFEDDDFYIESPPSRKLRSNGCQNDSKTLTLNSDIQNISQSPKAVLNITPNKTYQANDSLRTVEQIPLPCKSSTDLSKPVVKQALKCNNKPTFKTPFSQPAIYERLFKMKYDAHRAESDTLALMQICGYSGSQFATWADKNQNNFSDVKPRKGTLIK